MQWQHVNWLPGLPGASNGNVEWKLLTFNKWYEASYLDCFCFFLFLFFKGCVPQTETMRMHCWKVLYFFLCSLRLYQQQNAVIKVWNIFQATSSSATVARLAVALISCQLLQFFPFVFCLARVCRSGGEEEQGGGMFRVYNLQIMEKLLLLSKRNAKA